MMKNITFASLLLTILLTGCSVEDKKEKTTPSTDSSQSSDDSKSDSKDSSSLTGEIVVDGSSTVFLVSQAVAEEFQKLNPQVKVKVSSTGTGGGFKKFVRGENDINDASRPIKESEIEKCKEGNIEYLELPIAIDGLTVVVNPQNNWCDSLTQEQLNSIWKKDSKVQTWKDVNPDWPDEKIKLYGPDVDSGTFDFFTEVINGEGGSCRTDYTPNSDDNFLVVGIAGDKYSLGYFGYAYYRENKNKLKAIGVAPETKADEAVVPTDESINNGSYSLLSRPLFIYVNKSKLAKPEVASFLQYYLQKGQDQVDEVGYIRLDKAKFQKSIDSLDEAIKALKK